MKRIYIEDISHHTSEEVKICGWLYNKRSSGKLWFLLIRDGTGIIQAIVSKSDVDSFDLFSTPGYLVYHPFEFRNLASPILTANDNPDAVIDKADTHIRHVCDIDLGYSGVHTRRFF